MNLRLKAGIGLGLAILLHLLLFWIKSKSDPLWWQQDDYFGYSQGSSSQTWLWPGLAGLLLILPPWLVAGLSLVTIYWTSYLLTKSWVWALGVTLFPPIVWEQTSKLSTESIVMALWLLSYYLIRRKRIGLAGLTLGLATVVRPIGSILWLAMARRLGKGNLAGLIFPALLIGFNIFYLKSTPWHQIDAYRRLTPVAWPILQLPADIWRAVDWGYWRILASGLSYLLLSFGLVVLSWKKRKNVILRIWSLGVLIFIFAVGPAPFLEEFRRYVSVIFPLIITINYRELDKLSWFKVTAFLLAGFAFV